MRTRPLVLAAAVVAVAVFAPDRVSAHDLQLVVKVPPDRAVVVVGAGFDDDTPAEAGRVVVTAADGSVVAEGKTDEKGVFTFARPGPGKYTATVEALGHKDRVEFEIVCELTVPAEYRGWRPDQTVGLAVGVGGLLGVSAGYWWVRRRKAAA